MISIIIPCFNTGEYLLDAIHSCLTSTYLNIEVIIVNDGSTEGKTLEILKNILDDNVIVVHKENGGPASARNFGVSKAKGDFLFFLDSDNLVHPEYFEKAINVVNADSKIAVVYSKPIFFGSPDIQDYRFETKTFNFDALLRGNYIDMCSLVRKESFSRINGFDESKSLIICEDWDLWIRIAQQGLKFHFLNDALFYYRIRPESLMGSADLARRQEMLRYLGNKHSQVIHKKYRQYFRIMEKIQERPFYYFLRILYNKYFLRQPFIK